MTPAPVVSFGTVAVMVTTCPAVILSEVAWRTTSLKFEGTPEQLAQLLLCRKTKKTRHKMGGNPLRFAIATP